MGTQRKQCIDNTNEKLSQKSNSEREINQEKENKSNKHKPNPPSLIRTTSEEKVISKKEESTKKKTSDHPQKLGGNQIENKSTDVSQKLAQKLLSGWKMLDIHCPRDTCN